MFRRDNGRTTASKQVRSTATSKPLTIDAVTDADGQGRHGTQKESYTYSAALKLTRDQSDTALHGSAGCMRRVFARSQKGPSFVQTETGNGQGWHP